MFETIKQYFININKREFINSLLFYFFSILAIFFIIYITVMFSQRNLIEQDDALGIFGETYRGSLCNEYFKVKYDIIYEYIVDVYHGKFISNFLIKYIGFIIPAHFKIHPVSWIQTGAGIIKGLSYCLLSFLFAKCIFLYNKRNILLPFVSVILFLFIQLSHIDTYQIQLYSAFYSFTFIFVFFFLFWSLYIRTIAKDSYTKIEVILLIIYSILLAISSELTAISSLIALFLITLYYGFTKHLNFRLSLTCFITMFISILIYLLNPSFRTIYSAKGGLNLTLALKSLSEYKSVFIEEFLIYTIIIVLFSTVIFFILKSKDKVNFLVIIYSLLISGFIFYSSLLFIKYFDGINSYVSHFDLILQMKIYLISIIFYEISLIYNSRKTYYFIVSIGILIIFVLNFSQIINVFSEVRVQGIKSYISKYCKNSDEYYKMRYLDERILAWYVYNNKVPLLLNENDILYTYSSMFKLYHQKLYGYFDYFDDIKYTDSIDEVYAKYIESGGCEIKNEDIENPDFQKLLDKNYVLTCN